MRLTDHTDYSLRILIYLNQCKRLVTLNELSTELRISKNNLIKASNHLAKLGFITTARGRAGGLWIGDDAGKRSLKEIIQKTENFNIAECFSKKDSQCTFRNGCLLKKSFREAVQAFLNSLGQTTLNDVTMHRRTNLKI